MDDLLDFEKEDLLLARAPRVVPKRKKVIELDDLLNDFHVEKNKTLKKNLKKSKTYDSDENDTINEKAFCKFVNECQKQVSEIGTEDEAPIWDQKAFGLKMACTTLEKPNIENSKLLRSFSQNSLASIFNLDTKQGESILEGLLINGFLLNLVIKNGSLEKSIAYWIFYTMLYSSNEELQNSACDFWCNILQLKNEAGELLINIEWFPNYSSLKDALISYGYIYSSSKTTSQIIQTDSKYEGPPINISSWIKSLSVCCKLRKIRPIFTNYETEELLQIIIWLHLDRDLLGLESNLNSCLQLIINYFTDSEWTDSCPKVAKSIALRVPKDLNCLRIVECVTGNQNRIKYLRCQLALHLLIILFDNKGKGGEEILKLLSSINVKEKDCDLFRVYLCLGLTENMMLVYHPFEEKFKVVNLWCKFLRNCSLQITTTDWRRYASKVRNKASYILQNMKFKENN